MSFFLHFAFIYKKINLLSLKNLVFMKYIIFLSLLIVAVLLEPVCAGDDADWGSVQRMALMKRPVGGSAGGAGAGAGSGSEPPKAPPRRADSRAAKVDAFLAGGAVSGTEERLRKSRKEVLASSDDDFKDLACRDLRDVKALSLINYGACAPGNPGFPDHNKNSYVLRRLEATALVSLELRNCDFSGGFPFSSLPSLNSLSFSYCAPVSDGVSSDERKPHNVMGVLRKALSSFPATNLQVLTLFWCGEVSDAVLELISASCPNLKELSFNEGGGVTDDGMISVTERLTQLTKLCAMNCHDLSDEGLTHMARLPLVELQLPWGHRIKSIEKLLGCTGLTSLSLQGCEGLESISGIQTLRSLKLLDVSFCRELRSSDGIDTLVGLQAETKHSGLLKKIFDVTPAKAGRVIDPPPS